MGNTNSMNKINFEDVQFLLNNNEKFILINTLNETEQECLLPNTISPEKEILIINSLLSKQSKNIKIIIYGKNCNDEKIYKKYNQLQNLGFYNCYIYTGGLFEWLLLQDIYGDKEFPTTKKELDILKFKSRKIFDVCLIEY
jgi:rhodanese-related sulfurtransferase